MFEISYGVCYNSKDLGIERSDEMSSFMEKAVFVVYICYAAVVSVMLDKLFPVIGSGIKVILGMVLNQFWKIPRILDRGSIYSAKKLLHYPLSHLGFTVRFAQVSQTGASSFPVTD